MTLAFHMTADVALDFFELVETFGIKTQEDRIELIKTMIDEGYKITVFETNRTPQQIADDAAKHGRVLVIKPKEDEDETYSNT